MRFAILSSLLLVILCHCYVTAENISDGEINLEIPKLLQDAAEMSAKNEEDMCQFLLQRFSNSSSQFTLCANQYARPINMCRQCKDHFLNVRNYYYALDHSEQEGIKCKELLTSQDHVEIIQETYQFIVSKDGLWDKGFCSSCYTLPLTSNSTIKDEAIAFFALFRSVQDCFKSHPENKTSVKSEACTECAIDYYKLLDFYKDSFLNDVFPHMDGICFDILDAMNSTQHTWGVGKYHCGRKIGSNFPLILAIILVLMTPVALYLGVRFAPGTRRAQERVITQTTIQEIITQAQENAQEEVDREETNEQFIISEDR